MNLLKESGADFEVIEYLKDIPSFAELKDILIKLDKKPQELLRKGEKVFKKKFKGMNFTDEEWIQVMVENPVLIERPVVVKEYKAIIGRPPENVFDLL